MKKLATLIIGLTLANVAQADALIFDGKSDYSHMQDGSSFGTRVYRGSAAQQQHDALIDSQQQQHDQEIQDKSNPLKNNDSFVGVFELSNITNVKSNITINTDGSFYWYMKYKNTYLNTSGKWESDGNTLVLNTNPMPSDIMFEYDGSKGISQTDDTQNMSQGDLSFSIYQKSSNLLSSKFKPIKDVKISCLGMYGLVQTKTDEAGKATCERAGYPIRKLTLQMSDLPNQTYWMNPKFTGTHWNFSFDLMSAHTGYAFSNERFTFNNGSLVWDGRTLGANQSWVYTK